MPPYRELLPALRFGHVAVGVEDGGAQQEVPNVLFPCQPPPSKRLVAGHRVVLLARGKACNIEKTCASTGDAVLRGPSQ